MSFFLRTCQFSDGVLDLYFTSSSLHLCLLLCLLLCSSTLPQSGLWWPMIGFTLPIPFQSPSLLLPYHSSDGSTFDLGSCWGLLYIFILFYYYTFLKMLLSVQLMSLYLERLWDGYTGCPGPRPVWVDIYGSKNRAFVYLLGERGTFYVFSPWSWEWFFLKKVKKWHGTVRFCWCSLLAHLSAYLRGGEPCRGHVSLNRGICTTSKSLGETWLL